MTTNSMYSALSYPLPIHFLNPRRLKFLLLLGDILGVLGCFTLALWVRLGQLISMEDSVLLGFVALVAIGLYLADAYCLEVKPNQLQISLRICLSSMIVGIVSAALVYLMGLWGHDGLLGRGILLPGLGLGMLWSIGLRLAAKELMRSRSGQSRWLLLGSSEQAIKFSEDFCHHSVGRLLALNEPTSEKPDLSHSLLHQLWSGVVMEPQSKFSDEQWQLLMKLRLRGTPVYYLADFYETFWQKLPSAMLEDTWFTLSQGFQLRIGQLNWKLKRLIDLGATLILSVTLAPIMVMTALAIQVESPGPILYSQVRTGWNGHPFKVYKFRSMYQDAEARGAQWAQERDPRITRVGHWLRILRIDELPQIWNVLRGEMSLIGPRPERPEFDTKLAEVIPYYELRYLVKPGITGWAQVMYPYGASIEDSYEKLSYDLYYIKNYSIWLDAVIAAKTIRVVLLGKGR